MKMNPEGMELFQGLCKRLQDIDLIAVNVKDPDGSGKEVVSFFYNEEIQQRVSDPCIELPVATVKYIAEDLQLLRNEVTGVSLKFYYSPLFAVGLAPLLENYKRYRTELQGSQESSFYNYIFVDPYTREHVYEYIDALFISLYKEMNSIGDHLPLTDAQLHELVLM